MTTITAVMVKDLRARTGAGMMECKKALVEAQGDIEVAIEQMRKSGMARADKKAGRTATEGVIVIKISEDGRRAVMVEVNSETDFVAKGDDFQAFASDVAVTALEQQVPNLDALLSATMATGETVADSTRALIGRLGENMDVRRFRYFATERGRIAHYLHGVRIGAVVITEGGDDGLGHDIAMHIAASRPQAISTADVPADLIAKEKGIFSAQAAESDKPPHITEKIVSGRINKFLKEITLLGQPFVKDPDMTIEMLLNGKGAKVIDFACFKVGEGVEKQVENFADEVRAQVKGN